MADIRTSGYKIEEETLRKWNSWKENAAWGVSKKLEVQTRDPGRFFLPQSLAYLVITPGPTLKPSHISLLDLGSN